MSGQTDRQRLLQLLAAPIALSLAECSQDGTTTDDTAESHSYMDSNTEGLVTITSDESVQATVSRIESAIEESPLTLMTTVDHADNATSIKKELPPTTLLLFGNPDVGTPLMQTSRTIGLNLPQRMLV